MGIDTNRYRKPFSRFFLCYVWFETLICVVIREQKLNFVVCDVPTKKEAIRDYLNFCHCLLTLPFSL